MASTSSNTSAARANGPARLACLQCRQKHLKCDGGQPICNRCSEANTQCMYTASRRGYRGPSKRKHANDSSLLNSFSLSNIETTHNNRTPSISTASSNPSPWIAEAEYTSYPSVGPSDASLMESDPFLFGQLLHNVQPSQGLDAQGQASVPSHYSPPPAGFDEKLVNLYYSNFHRAHPILPPLSTLLETQPPRHLLTVLEFIGCHFSTNTTAIQALRTRLLHELSQAFDNSVALVQTRLLTAIVLHARNEQREAVNILNAAIDLGLEIGLHNRPFASTYGRRDPLIEESFRRTWWELYVVDGILAGLHQENGFRTAEVQAGVALPCEEHLFALGQHIPQPPILEQFLERFFAPDDLHFSSFCYRIEAVRLLSQVLAVASSPEGTHEEAESAGTALASWIHHLPQSKREVLDSEGDIDEILFQAHMIVNSAAIYLNLPRSNLAAARPAKSDIQCARRRSFTAATASSHVHAVNAIKAAKELSSLASLPVPVHKHSPFFICSTVLSAIVQLSACCIHACTCLEPHRQQIIQSIGLLRTLGEVWPVAFHVLKQIRSVANEVTKTGVKALSPESHQANPMDDSKLIQQTLWDPTSFGFDLGQHTFSEG